MKGEALDLRDVMARMERLANPRNVAGMARYGIHCERAYGLSAPQLRTFAREIGRDHGLARRLWATGVYEARALAVLVEEPAHVTAAQMDRWARAFENWAICDCACNYLFRRTPFARRKILAWSRRPEEFVKRAAFALIAVLAIHDKTASDALFGRYLSVIRREATDERNGVKKAVNWALRQIGKRSAALNARAIQTAESIRRLDSKAARWIAADALRELRSPVVRRRLAQAVT